MAAGEIDNVLWPQYYEYFLQLLCLPKYKLHTGLLLSSVSVPTSLTYSSLQCIQ